MELIALGPKPKTHSAADTPVALIQKGFRVFFLLAGMFALVSVPFWLAALSSAWVPSSAQGVVFWHSHEMVFGYGVAVIAGFLLTAVEKWTGRPTASPSMLTSLALLWCLGRLCFFTLRYSPPALTLAVDMAFLPLLTVVLARPILASKNRRNYLVVLVLGGMASGNLLMHLAALGYVPELSGSGARLGLNLSATLLLLVGARVIPMFTRNATGDGRIALRPGWAWASVVGMLFVTVAELLGATGRVPGLLASFAAACALINASRWGTRQTLKHPLLWSLHLGYFWIVAALALRGLQNLGAALLPSTAIHALTIGGLGTLTLSMMMRVSLGHTGRLLVASGRMRTSLLLMQFAALLRVVLPELLPLAQPAAWRLSGMLWTASFLLFVLEFRPMWFAPRVDGLPG